MTAAVQDLKASRKRMKIASKVAGQVESVLRGEAGVKQANVQMTAQIAGLVASTVVTPPPAVGFELSSHRVELENPATKMIMAFAGQSLKGRGLGEVVGAEEGKARLGAVSVAMPLEEWADAVAGSTELERTMGISRSTLHKWQKSGAVIALLKGTKSHVFPVIQFIDGRPLKGISEVNRLAPSPRKAWLWLIQENELLLHRAPIDVLRNGEVARVIGAAQEDFGRC